MNWTRPPVFTGDTPKGDPIEVALAMGQNFDDGAVVDDAVDLGEWREAITVRGEAYWWNVRTRESRWKRPGAEDGAS